MNERAAGFEQGPIRPPSEAQSLLVRVTRNCTWNRCEFCSTYKNEKFSRRSVEEVKNDIRAAKNIANDAVALSWKMGQAGRVTREVVQYIFDNPGGYGEQFRSVAAWLYLGGTSAFLQDADSIILPTDDLVEILTFLREQFPSVTRVTSYARSKSVSKSKTAEDMIRLRKAGLDRLHIGLETGYDPLLKYIQKGVTAAEHIDAGQKVRASGIELSEYVLLGLGGRKWAREHALETARVLSQIDANFIRFRTLKVKTNMPLYQKVASGEFELQSEEEVVREQRLLIEHLENITSYVASDHILNLLMEVEGRLPEAKQSMLDTIDRFLDMSEDDKINFRIGKRAGIYETMDGMNNPALYQRVEAIRRQIEQNVPGGVEEAISKIKETFL